MFERLTKARLQFNLIQLSIIVNILLLSSNYRKTEEKKAEPEPEAPKVESDPESDVDIDNEGCVEPDNDPPQVRWFQITST